MDRRIQQLLDSANEMGMGEGLRRDATWGWTRVASNTAVIDERAQQMPEHVGRQS